MRLRSLQKARICLKSGMAYHYVLVRRSLWHAGINGQAGEQDFQAILLAKGGPDSLRESATRSQASGNASLPEPRIDAFLYTHAGRIVAGLCVYAALRILVFAAAFPLFNITDEDSHFLTIRMYADGHLPGRDLPAVDPEFEKAFVLYGSPEYTHTQDDLERNGPRIPLYQLPPEARGAALAQAFYVGKLKDWSEKPNFEAQSPPLYYATAAGWYKLGAGLGIKEWRLIYWVRFFNSIAYALLVWVSYRFTRKVCPERPFLYVAVPALIAVFPQDVFFGMNRDVLSAPLAAVALLLMMEALDSAPGKFRWLILSSLVVGLGLLVEVSNCVLYGTLVATFWYWLCRPGIKRARKMRVVSIGVLAALGPPGLWMLRNYLEIGDLTGSRAKMHELGWTLRPMAEVFHHPLFSWDGLSYFLLQLTRSFWHGEYLWHGRWMRSEAADWFYVSSSALMIVIFAVELIRQRDTVSHTQRLAGFQSLFLVTSSVLFLAAISLPFDFHDCLIPSRLHPFFVNGRIISGALLPFVFIYASGLEAIATRLRRWIPPAALLVVLLSFITVTEIMVRRPAFASPYNFFALSAWRH